ncbi:hypothetical protein AYI68_g3747, partial [Smittium mucronatum]
MVDSSAHLGGAIVGIS